MVSKVTPNVEAWTYSFAEQGYLSGFVASKLGAPIIGIIGGPDSPFIAAAHKGFKAAVQENGGARVLEVFTGNFDDAQKASEATKGILAQGGKVVWCSGDGICNGVAAAANDANVLTLGITGRMPGPAAAGERGGRWSSTCIQRIAATSTEWRRNASARWPTSAPSPTRAWS